MMYGSLRSHPLARRARSLTVGEPLVHPEWDSTHTDLTRHKLSGTEKIRRALAIVSPNNALAATDLRKRLGIASHDELVLRPSHSEGCVTLSVPLPPAASSSTPSHSDQRSLLLLEGGSAASLLAQQTPLSSRRPHRSSSSLVGALWVTPLPPAAPASDSTPATFSRSGRAEGTPGGGGSVAGAADESFDGEASKGAFADGGDDTLGFDAPPSSRSAPPRGRLTLQSRRRSRTTPPGFSPTFAPEAVRSPAPEAVADAAVPAPAVTVQSEDHHHEHRSSTASAAADIEGTGGESAPSTSTARPHLFAQQQQQQQRLPAYVAVAAARRLLMSRPPAAPASPRLAVAASPQVAGAASPAFFGARGAASTVAATPQAFPGGGDGAAPRGRSTTSRSPAVINVLVPERLADVLLGRIAPTGASAASLRQSADAAAAASASLATPRRFLPSDQSPMPASPPPSVSSFASARRPTTAASAATLVTMTTTELAFGRGRSPRRRAVVVAHAHPSSPSASRALPAAPPADWATSLRDSAKPPAPSAAAPPPPAGLSAHHHRYQTRFIDDSSHSGEGLATSLVDPPCASDAATAEPDAHSVFNWATEAVEYSGGEHPSFLLSATAPPPEPSLPSCSTALPLGLPHSVERHLAAGGSAVGGADEPSWLVSAAVAEAVSASTSTSSSVPAASTKATTLLSPLTPRLDAILARYEARIAQLLPYAGDAAARARSDDEHHPQLQSSSSAPEMAPSTPAPEYASFEPLWSHEEKGLPADGEIASFASKGEVVEQAPPPAWTAASVPHLAVRIPDANLLVAPQQPSSDHYDDEVDEEEEEEEAAAFSMALSHQQLGNVQEETGGGDDVLLYVPRAGLAAGEGTRLRWMTSALPLDESLLNEPTPLPRAGLHLPLPF